MPDIKGVDLASFQGLPGQWVNEPGAQGIAWAAVKLSEVKPDGSVYQNPDAKADWDYLWSAKKGRVAYLFAHPGASVSASVNAFKAMTDHLGLVDDDGIAVDLEVTDGRSPAAVASWARELVAELAKLYGRVVIIYTYVDFVKAGNCEGLEACLLWIASLTTAGLPDVPGPWKDWFAQQYAVAGGGVNKIDQDVAHFSSLAAMQAAMGKPEYKTIVAVHVTTGEENLISLSHLLRCGISTMIRLTLNGSADHLFSPEWAVYLDWGDFRKNMPKGLTVRYYEQVRT